MGHYKSELNEHNSMYKLFLIIIIQCFQGFWKFHGCNFSSRYTVQSNTAVLGWWHQPNSLAVYSITGDCLPRHWKSMRKSKRTWGINLDKLCDMGWLMDGTTFFPQGFSQGTMKLFPAIITTTKKGVSFYYEISVRFYCNPYGLF